ncbi:alpha/beta hydrolase [Desulfogranum marinum]|uniref:alpha/beta hydrolase n=1 Tax=Desulfogranum marinum TaxID=453220 RepID=UPI001963B346|nr:alpha/beta hydrolase [Desulfogranum marinum]MBM9515112.1 lysophospholipase [Desulfogranum marinum]
MKVWLPDHATAGVIIAVHGFNDYSNSFKNAAAFFNDHHLAVYSYDQRGFGATKAKGRWAGTKAMVKDLSVFITHVSQTYPSLPVYILGDSMGGAVAIAALAKENPAEIQGVILVAPAVWARSEMPFYQRWLLWIAAHTLPWKKVTGEFLEITASDNIEMLKELSKDPLVIKATRVDTLYGLSNLMDEAYRNAELLRVNTLILYGEKDEIIPREPVFKLYKRLPLREDQVRPQLIVYENGYHMLLRDLQAENVMSDIVEWIKAQHKFSPVFEKNLGNEYPSGGMITSFNGAREKKKEAY